MKILIIGGGIAGLTAAYQLEKLGLEYHLIERSRIGGRIYTHTLETPNGVIYHDMGAEYFLSSDKPLMSLIEQLDLEIEEYLSNRAIFDIKEDKGILLPNSNDSKLAELKKIIQIIDFIGFKNLHSLIKLKSKVTQYLREVDIYYKLLENQNLESMYSDIKTRYAKYFATTLENFLKKEGLKIDFIRKLVNPLFRAIYMLDGDKLNALFGVLGFAAKNAKIFRIKNGNSRLIKSLQNQIPMGKVLSGEVVAVTNYGEEYSVVIAQESSRITLKTNFIYFATPLTSLKSVLFSNLNSEQTNKLVTLKEIKYNNQVFHHLILAEPNHKIHSLIKRGADTIFIANGNDIIEINKIKIIDKLFYYFDITSTKRADKTQFFEFFLQVKLIHTIHWNDAYPLYTPQTMIKMPSSTLISKNFVAGTDSFMTSIGHSVHTSKLVVKHIKELEFASKN